MYQIIRSKFEKIPKALSEVSKLTVPEIPEYDQKVNIEITLFPFYN